MPDTKQPPAADDPRLQLNHVVGIGDKVLIACKDLELAEQLAKGLSLGGTAWLRDLTPRVIHPPKVRKPV